MTFIFVAAGMLWLTTLLLAAVWRGVIALRRKPAPRYWRHVLVWHAFLLPLHLFATVPFGFTLFITRNLGTRGDERGYLGPRFAADGTWQLQERGAVVITPPPEDHEVHFTTRDGVVLRGFLVPPRPERCGPDGAPRFTVLLVHGLFRGALELETPGAMFRELGGEVLLLELRNHGGSGRARATFGRDEALDVLAAADFLRTRPEARGSKSPPFVLFAVSLGTAAAVLATPQLPELSALILDAPMDDLAETAQRMLGGGQGMRRFQAFWEPWRTLMLWAARHLARVPFDEVRPRDVLARLRPTLPVLLIGAGHDDRMPPGEVRALFDLLPTRPELKELWIVPEAEHGKVWVAEPAAYRDHLAAFLGRLAPG